MKEAAASVLAILFIGVLWAFLQWHQSGARLQPIAYNHKKHVSELGLECAFCHTGIAEKKARAGLPNLETCLSCHTSEDTNPKAKVIQDYASKNQPIPWKQVYKTPPHVYFSHRRHVELAKLDCAVCHGDMSKKETPVSRPAIAISMERCMDCHRRKNVTNDCMSCHR